MRGRDRISEAYPSNLPESKPQRRILVADDEAVVRALLVKLCERMGYITVEASNGAAAIELARTGAPDLVLMDAKMPKVDGFTATERLKADPKTAQIPILILTGLTTREDRLRGIAAGANDLLGKPIDAEELLLRVRNNLQVKEFHDFLKRHNEILEQQVAERTRRLSETIDTLRATHITIEHIHRDTIYRLSALAEFRDEDTGVHIRRIGHFAREISVNLGLDQEFQEAIYYAAMLHDIGKVAVPDSILLKNDRLTDEEWQLMWTHTTTGARILEGAESPYLQMGALIAQNHHERWDGTGYPAGLVAKAIPLPARIAALADCYDALRSTRPYKPAFDHDESCRIITEGDGRTHPDHFCPEVLAAFKRIQTRFDEIFAEHPNE